MTDDELLAAVLRRFARDEMNMAVVDDFPHGGHDLTLDGRVSLSDEEADAVRRARPPETIEVP